MERKDSKASAQATLQFTIMSSTSALLELKTGPQGNIPSHDYYKALYAAFASYMRIQQLNKRQGTNEQGKMAPIVAETMDIDLDSAQELLNRLSCNTAVDMSCDKLNFAEERRVRWTTYSNLQLWFGTWERPNKGSHSFLPINCDEY